MQLSMKFSYYLSENGGRHLHAANIQGNIPCMDINSQLYTIRHLVTRRLAT